MADDASDLKTMTADLIASFVSNNPITPTELPRLVRSVYSALGGLDLPPEPEPASHERPSPYQIKKSITPEALISFIDGKPYKSLKRHIQSRGMTVEDYRRTYGLPTSYPMVSEATSAMRSAFAKSIGLGRKAASPKPPPAKPKPSRTKRRKDPVDPR